MERPILFSGAMVRALLDGSKTQTRRVVKPQPVVARDGHGIMVADPKSALPPGEQRVYAQAETMRWESPRYDNGDGVHYFHTDIDSGVRLMEPFCPYGVPGDRLWVRETWYCDHCFVGDYHLTTNSGRVGADIEPDRGKCEAEWREMLSYRAEHRCSDWEAECPCTPPSAWKPSIHMPRWASRITLEITDVRVQRVQEISEEDAQAEGCGLQRCRGCGYTADDADIHLDHIRCGLPSPPRRRDGYRTLWDFINAKRGYGWEANPWVWALTFKRAE